MRPLGKLRLAIDKEWIKAGWSGSPTLRHRGLALAPTAVLAIPAIIIEPWSYEISAFLLISGIFATCGLLFFIATRPMLVMSTTKRSDRMAKRNRLKANRKPADSNEPRSTKGQ